MAERHTTRWVGPQLLVLTRSTQEETVLASCKGTTYYTATNKGFNDNCHSNNKCNPTCNAIAVT